MKQKGRENKEEDRIVLLSAMNEKKILRITVRKLMETRHEVDRYSEQK